MFPSLPSYFHYEFLGFICFLFFLKTVENQNFQVNFFFSFFNCITHKGYSLTGPIYFLLFKKNSRLKVIVNFWFNLKARVYLRLRALVKVSILMSAFGLGIKFMV